MMHPGAVRLVHVSTFGRSRETIRDDGVSYATISFVLQREDEFRKRTRRNSMRDGYDGCDDEGEQTKDLEL